MILSNFLFSFLTIIVISSAELKNRHRVCLENNIGITMPSLNVIRSAISNLPDSGPLVVVLPGGTTGIGSYIANSLARVFATQGSSLRVYIVGRNAARAESVIEYGKSVSPGSDLRFIHATDLALISEVDRACANIIQQEKESPLHTTPCIDLLYMSFCVNIFAPPKRE